MQLQVVKQIFEVFIDRTLAYNYSNHIGLIMFCGTPTVSQKITGIVEDFRSAVQGLTTGGSTAIWNALKLAESNLNEYASSYPKARKRIVCLTDGENNSSSYQPVEVCRSLRVVFLWRPVLISRHLR